MRRPPGRRSEYTMPDEGSNTVVPEGPNAAEGEVAENGEGAARAEMNASPGAPPADRDRIGELEEELAKREEEAKTNYDRFLRERADLENFKRRAAREREDTLRYGHEDLVRGLLPVLDNLERAVEHAIGGHDGQSLLEGVTLVLKGLRDVLEQHGVRAISSLGERFDPAVHEAMEQVESDEHDANVVVREHQKGYVLHDRLIRPALVGVSKPPARQVEAEKPENGPDES